MCVELALKLLTGGLQAGYFGVYFGLALQEGFARIDAVLNQLKGLGQAFALLGKTAVDILQGVLLGGEVRLLRLLHFQIIQKFF